VTTERWSSTPSAPPASSQVTSTSSSATSSPTPAVTQQFGAPAGAFGASPSQSSPSKIVSAFPLDGAPLTERADSGPRLAHFRVDTRIAAGGMGEVFLGFDTSLQRPVAIKTIRTELAADSGFLARFLREATAQANVVHPSVVQVYYVGRHLEDGQETWFLAMQVVDGGSLQDTLKRGERLTWQQAAVHMQGLVEGLVVAEERGIVHRDIKPANILLDKSGRALLADFGLAVAAGSRDTSTSTTPAPALGEATPSGVHGSQLQLMGITQVGVVMGTPEYVAPEQLQVGAVDVRADIYALAATFFHLLAGQPVAPCETLAAAMAHYQAGKRAPPLRSLRRDVPRAFADVIDRCLSLARDDRPASMRELLQLVRRAAPQPTVPATPLVRAVAWAVDVAPFVALGAAAYEAAPWAAPLLFFVAGLAGLIVVGSSPGVWMLRLRLRTVDDGDVSVGRGFARFLLQHGWMPCASVGFSALYASSALAPLFVVGAVWFAVIALGALGALGGARQTLHDKVTRTRVLVDIRT
jgi:serine/threonine protein kinase